MVFVFSLFLFLFLLDIKEFLGVSRGTPYRSFCSRKDKNRWNDTAGVDTPWLFAYRVYAADIFDFRRVSNLMEINDGSEIEAWTPRDKKNTPECILPFFARLFAFAWQESSCVFSIMQSIHAHLP